MILLIQNIFKKIQYYHVKLLIIGKTTHEDIKENSYKIHPYDRLSILGNIYNGLCVPKSIPKYNPRGIYSSSTENDYIKRSNTENISKIRHNLGEISKERSSNISNVMISQQSERIDCIEIVHHKEYSYGINQFLRQREEEFYDSTPQEESSHYDDNTNQNEKSINNINHIDSNHEILKRAKNIYYHNEENKNRLLTEQIEKETEDNVSEIDEYSKHQCLKNNLEDDLIESKRTSYLHDYSRFKTQEPLISRKSVGNLSKSSIQKFQTDRVIRRKSHKNSNPTKTLSSSDKEENSLILPNKSGRRKSLSGEESKRSEPESHPENSDSSNLFSLFYHPKIDGFEAKLSNNDLSNPQSSSTIRRKSPVNLNKLKFAFK